MKLAFILFAWLIVVSAHAAGEFWIERGVMTGDQQTSVDGTLLITEQDLALPFGDDRGTISLEATQWPGGVLIWDIDPMFRNDSELFNGVLAAIKQISSSTVLKFKRRTNESNFINIIREGNSCYSEIGMKGRRQVLSLGQGCTAWHVAAHELLHAAGLLHEHTRGDRDKYIQILTSNLGPLGASNFSVVRHRTDGPFDFDSIMLYRSFAYPPFVINANVPMWVRRDNGQPMRQDNTDLSVLDIKTVNDLYGAIVNPNPNPTKPNPNDGNKIDTSSCKKVDYVNSRGFEQDLLESVTTMNQFGSVKCVSVVFQDEFQMDLLPERMNDWLVAIKSTGGSVQQVAVSRSWFKEIIDMIIKILTGRDLAAIKDQASKLNAVVYYDKETNNVLEIKLAPRE